MEADSPLIDAVMDLLNISQEEVEEIQEYTLRRCEAEVTTLLEEVKDPQGGAVLIQSMVGKLLLLDHHRNQLQMGALRGENDELRVSRNRLETRNSSLQDDIEMMENRLREFAQRLQVAEGASQSTADKQVRREGLETRDTQSLPASELSEEVNFEPRRVWNRNPVRAPVDLVQVKYRGPTSRQFVETRLDARYRDDEMIEVPPLPDPDASRRRSRRTTETGGSPQSEATRRLPRQAAPYTSSDSDSDTDEGRRPHEVRERSVGSRLRQIDSIAKDIERFDPDDKHASVIDYLREIRHGLTDLDHATSQEKLKLIWKTTSRSTRRFIETQPPRIRDSFSKLCRVLREEYAPSTDRLTATLSAAQIKQRRTESPREYYRRLRGAYFQGSSTPGQEEDDCHFRLMFIHNLHSSVRTHVTLACEQRNHTIGEIKRIAQVLWETTVRAADRYEEEPRVLNIQTREDTELEGCGVPLPNRRNTAPPKLHYSLSQKGREDKKSTVRSRTLVPAHSQERAAPQDARGVHFEQAPAWRKRHEGQEPHDPFSELQTELGMIRRAVTQLTKLRTPAPTPGAPGEQRGPGGVAPRA